MRAAMSSQPACAGGVAASASRSRREVPFSDRPAGSAGHAFTIFCAADQESEAVLSATARP